jgi:hypothetical protein
MRDNGLVSVRYMVEDVEVLIDDIGGEVQRPGAAGVQLRNEIVSGPGGHQILLEDPSGNPIERFQPSQR